MNVTCSPGRPSSAFSTSGTTRGPPRSPDPGRAAPPRRPAQAGGWSARTIRCPSSARRLPGAGEHAVCCSAHVYLDGVGALGEPVFDAGQRVIRWRLWIVVLVAGAAMRDQSDDTGARGERGVGGPVCRGECGQCLIGSHSEQARTSRRGRLSAGPRCPSSTGPTAAALAQDASRSCSPGLDVTVEPASSCGHNLSGGRGRRGVPAPRELPPTARAGQRKVRRV